MIFDEPTAAMGVRESAAVLRLIGGLAARGMAVVIICHNMHQVFDAADTVSVMRRAGFCARCGRRRPLWRMCRV